MKKRVKFSATVKVEFVENYINDLSSDSENFDSEKENEPIVIEISSDESDTMPYVEGQV